MSLVSFFRSNPRFLVFPVAVVVGVVGVGIESFFDRNGILGAK
jgi:hypothetical protein